MVEKLDGKSINALSEKKQKLAAIVPEAFSDGKVDCEKLKRALGEEVASGSERYRMEWAGKSGCFAELERQTTKTLNPDRKSSVDFDTTQNVFIEGENLEVLKVLQKSYYGQVKMIYIDPPYNTGNDFVYRDKFAESEEEYLEEAGDLDEQGNLARDFRKNSKEGGRYHSNWLTMMYPRLYLARNLLRDDGVIFVSIDDNEVHNLRLIMNEIFGEENFICEIVREVIRGGSQSKHIRQVHDYVLVYARDKESARFSGIAHDGFTLDEEDEKGKFIRGRELNKWGAGSRRADSPSMWFPILGPNGEEVYPYRNDGSEGRWRLGKKKITKLVEDGDVIFEKRENGTYVAYEKIRDDSPRYKQFTTLFLQKYTNAKGTETLKKTFSIERSHFDYVKPIELVKDLALMADVRDGEYVLDFFAGSGTTACAVMDLNNEDGRNRKWICVQLPEVTGKDSEAYKAGHKTIAELARARICKTGEHIEESVASSMSQRQLTINAGLANEDELETREVPDVGFKAFKLEPSNFKLWRMQEIDSAEELQKKLEDAIETKKNGAEKESVLFEIMLKAGIPLVTNREDKGAYYKLQDGEYIISLAEKLTKEIIASVLSEKPKVFIALDSSFDGDDTLKKNTELQMKDAQVEFKVV